MFIVALFIIKIRTSEMFLKRKINKYIVIYPYKAILFRIKNKRTIAHTCAHT